LIRAADAPAPVWSNLANGLTLLRVALVPVIAALLLAGGGTARWWACGVFLVAAISDSVDGFVARRAGISRWGQLADPAADKALIVGTLVVLAWLGDLPWWAVAVVALREVAVTVLRSVLARRGLVMPASIFGKVKTVLQVVAITLYLIPPVDPRVADAALWVAVAVTIASGLEYTVRARGLRRAG
jgi:CDP-diacylglycerol--glycerol-3-phosphate 3-phosphatidyltransferase